MFNLSQKDIIKFFENYGDGDTYYSHEYDGSRVIVKYFPKLTHFVDETSVNLIKTEVQNNPHLEKKYLRTIILTKESAHIPGGKNNNPLVKNYDKFLQSLQEKKYSKKTSISIDNLIEPPQRKRTNDDYKRLRDEEDEDYNYNHKGNGRDHYGKKARNRER